jgi:hypothetical protein
MDLLGDIGAGPTGYEAPSDYSSSPPRNGLEAFEVRLHELLDSGEGFPFYCALLYTWEEGLDQVLDEYVRDNWAALNALTGSDCFVFVVANRDFKDKDLRASQPEDVIAIARALGARMAALPAAVFFTDPRAGRDVCVVRLARFFPSGPHADTAEVKQGLRALFGGVHRTIRLTDPPSTVMLSHYLEDAQRDLFKDLGLETPEEKAAGYTLARGKSIIETLAALTTIFGFTSY